jgi:hypothetical protein
MSDDWVCRDQILQGQRRTVNRTLERVRDGLRYAFKTEGVQTRLREDRRDEWRPVSPVNLPLFKFCVISDLQMQHNCTMKNFN